MNRKNISILADAMELYYENCDLEELASTFDIKLEYYSHKLPHIRIARNIFENLNHGNNRKFLETLVESLIRRCDKGIAKTKFERQEVHLRMSDDLMKLNNELKNEPKLPSEISVDEDQPFLAKSEVREFLADAKTPVIIVDSFIGVETLDCLREVNQDIQILTGTHDQSIKANFDRGLKDFIAEGHKVEVRRHDKLHDRFILFDDKCWLIGSSLKDAGRKRLNIIEMVEYKIYIYEEINEKWEDSKKHNPK